MDKKDHYCVADSLGAGACPCGRMVTSEEEIKSPNAVVLIEYDSEGASMAAAYGPTETRSYSEIPL